MNVILEKKLLELEKLNSSILDRLLKIEYELIQLSESDLEPQNCTSWKQYILESPYV